MFKLTIPEGKAWRPAVGWFQMFQMVSVVSGGCYQGSCSAEVVADEEQEEETGGGVTA